MTILVVDDREENRYQLEVLLGGNGYQVVSVANGAEALAEARRQPPDLIISDILMPVMDGFALCREWKSDERLRSIPFIFYTATYTDQRDRDFALSLGADEFILKPEEPDNLLRFVREAVEAIRRAPSAAALTPEKACHLRQYNEELIRKLEDKMAQLEQSDRALQENEERYRLLFDSSIDAVLLTIPDGQILAANPAACRMFGRSEEELKHLGRDAVVDASDSGLVAALEERARTGLFRGELTFVRHDGSIFPGELSSAIFRTREGETHTSIIIRDITERRRVEQTLRESEIRFRGFFELSGVGFAMTSPTAGWLEVNDGACAILGYSREEIRQTTWMALTHPDDVENDVALFKRVLAGEITGYSIDKRFVRKDGECVWTSLSVRCVRRADGEVDYFAVLLFDITDRKKAEESIRDQLLELRRWHKVTLGREGRVLELKMEVNQLLARLGEPPRYASAKEEA